MDFTFKFHGGDLNFSVPDKNISFFAKPKDIPQAPDIAAEVRRAIRNPIGMETLSELVKKKGKKTTILVDDLTRTTPHKVILPILLEELNAAGVEDSDISILIALGTHRAMTREECINMYGEEAVNRIKIINHTWDKPENLIDMGTTPSGIPINVNKFYCESDISIAIGNIIPHVYAGWSGGGKMVQPGVCGKKTTARTHLLAAKVLDQVLGNADNPIRLEIESIARDSGLSMIINTVMNSDHSIAKVVAGDLVAAHREGVKYAQQVYCAEIPKDLPDITIVNAYPGNLDLWQTGKGMTAGAMHTKKGGDLILVTSAPEGMPSTHPTLIDISGKSTDELWDLLEKKQIVDEVAASVALTYAFGRERVNISIVTLPVNEEVIKKMNFTYVAPEKFNEKIDEIMKKHGPDCKIGIATHGADLAPKI